MNRQISKDMLHGVCLSWADNGHLGYFMELMSCNEEVNESIRPLLKLSRETVVRSQRLDYASKQTDGSLGSCLRRSARDQRGLAACEPSNPDVLWSRQV